MKWIPKIVSGLIVLALLAQQILSRDQSLTAEIVSDLLIVFFLLGIGEQVIMYCFVIIAQSFSKSLSVTKTQD